ncbi:APC family permease [Leucobacter ruminantium]|uniref:APC family permease n=1 Tax=Leucobacter ruminantium TaxID=1289170 RepID=A0A939S0D5_9MICO|nr:APC family permease [Leucobacter ruminantium]MBO1806409.1 APC family permease [Leucobacter ruminantium]
MASDVQTDERQEAGGSSSGLLKNSIRFVTIVLMVTAAAAPLVVVSTYIPLSIANGAGMTVPITYLTATLILLVFTVGFAQMAKRITASGAFYNFTTQGLGKPVGLGAGMTVMIGYSMISAAIQGGFGFFAAQLLKNYLNVDVPWWVCSIASLILMFVLAYFRVTLTGRILGIALGLEVAVVFVVATMTIVSGGAQGQMLETFNPAGWAAAPAVGIGFFFAFWSWIGFETTAIYGEETADPKKSVPKATYIAVITLGVFYTFAAYAGVVGFGDQSPEQASNLIDQYFFVLADMYTWPFMHVIMDFLVVTGFFACSFAFFNNAARYFFSMGRDGILPSQVGRTHPVHKSPYVANGLQAIIAIAVVVIFALIGADPVIHLGGWLPIFCTLSIILVQALVSLAVIRYFNREKRRTATDWWKTFIAPLIGFVAQAVVMYLLVINLPFLAGSEELVVVLIPVYVAIVFIVGLLWALYLRRTYPKRYARIGTIYEEEEIEEIAEQQTS